MPGPGKDSAVIVNHTANSTFSSDERHDATEDEIRTLQHVPDDKLPRTVWIALAISAAERFTFWAITTPWRKGLNIPVVALELTNYRKLHAK